MLMLLQIYYMQTHVLNAYKTDNLYIRVTPSTL